MFLAKRWKNRTVKIVLHTYIYIYYMYRMSHNVILLLKKQSYQIYSTYFRTFWKNADVFFLIFNLVPEIFIDIFQIVSMKTLTDFYQFTENS
jgi:hypothetical protein